MLTQSAVIAIVVWEVGDRVFLCVCVCVSHAFCGVCVCVIYRVCVCSCVQHVCFVVPSLCISHSKMIDPVTFLNFGSGCRSHHLDGAFTLWRACVLMDHRLWKHIDMRSESSSIPTCVRSDMLFNLCEP